MPYVAPTPPITEKAVAQSSHMNNASLWNKDSPVLSAAQTSSTSNISPTDQEQRVHVDLHLEDRLSSKPKSNYIAASQLESTPTGATDTLQIDFPVPLTGALLHSASVSMPASDEATSKSRFGTTITPNTFQPQHFPSSNRRPRTSGNMNLTLTSQLPDMRLLEGRPSSNPSRRRAVSQELPSFGTRTPDRAHGHIPQAPASAGPYISTTPGFSSPPIVIPEPAPEQVELFNSIRKKMSMQDQEAMKKMRQMMDLSDSGSSLASPIKASFSSAQNAIAGPSSQLNKIPLAKSNRSMLSAAVVDNIEVETRRDESGLLTSEPAHENTSTGPEADFVMAVIGHRGVGKSTVIKRALKAWDSGPSWHSKTTRNYTVTSTICRVQPGNKLKYAWTVELLELDLQALNHSEVVEIWPSDVIRPSGVVLCYDAQNRESLRDVESTVRKLARKGVPLVMLACKSDPDVVLEIEAAYGNSLAEPYNIGLIEVTALTPDGKSKMRNGLRWLLYKLEHRMRREQRQQSQERTPPGIAHSQFEEMTAAESDASSSGHGIMWNQDFRSLQRDQKPSSPAPSSDSSLQWVMKSPLRPDVSLEPPTPPSKSPRHGGNVEKLESNMYSNSSDRLAALNKQAPQYLSMTEIYNKLFTSLISGQEDYIVRTFFMTYRRFCEPHEVMQEFLNRFESIESSSISKDVKMWAQMKMAGALILWAMKYPGDLVEERTSHAFRKILTIIIRHTFMAHLTTELARVETLIGSSPDFDSSWSYHPLDQGKTPLTAPPRRVAPLEVRTSVLNSVADSTAGDSANFPEFSPSTLSPTRSASGVDRTPYSQAMYSGGGSSDSRSGYQSMTSETTKSTVSDDGPGTLSFAFNHVLSTEAKIFASELTKMHWELFKEVRVSLARESKTHFWELILKPRDVFRHDMGKEVDTPISRSINFFNLISRWVTNIILAGPKPRQRAKAYEKFVSIVHELRRLNNYDCVYAVISGLKETSVHRLSQTLQLVHLGVTADKEWQSHQKLMDPKGGHAFYRKALQADISHGRAAIPLIAVMLGLITRLQAARKEDRRPSDGMIQWDKFVKFAEILEVITECQEGQPMVTGSVSASFRQLIEETQITMDEDELFERSKVLEPSAGASGGVMKKLVSGFT